MDKLTQYIIGIIIGAIIGFLLAGAGYAVAAGHGMSLLDTLYVKSGFGSGSNVQKIYDQDTNTICFVMTNGSSGSAISCLKNI